MALRLHAFCLPRNNCSVRAPFNVARFAVIVLVTLLPTVPGRAQIAIRPAEPNEAVNLIPSDQAALEDDIGRRDIPCTVTERKPELGFDLRFHSGYDVNVPLKDLSGGDLLTILFRVYPAGDRAHSTYFVQHFHLPDIEDDAKGDALLQGAVDVGEGKYHVDWLMRDRNERICSSGWDVDASLGAKEKPIPLFIKPNDVAESSVTAFFNDTFDRAGTAASRGLSVKVW